MSLLFFFRGRVCGDANEVREKSSLLSLEERKKAPENHRRVYLSLNALFKTSILIVYHVSKSRSKRASSQTRNDV